MCTLKQALSTCGMNHSSPAPQSDPMAMLTPADTVRFHGSVPEPRKSCETGQCAIDVPVSAMRASSASVQCTE